jgi:hypothetical protein
MNTQLSEVKYPPQVGYFLSYCCFSVSHFASLACLSLSRIESVAHVEFALGRSTTLDTQGISLVGLSRRADPFDRRSEVIDMHQKILDRMDAICSVRDIMTPVKQLRRADTLGDAKPLFEEFDVVPCPRSGEITGFFQRGFDEMQPIEPEHLISESAPLVSLPALLETRRFFFILAGTKIIGYVHYSDLNKPITKIPFYALYQAIERGLWDDANHRITEAMLERIFSPQEVKEFLKKRADHLQENSDLDWTGVFHFHQIIKISRLLGLTHITDADIARLKEIRNRVAHSDRNLVEEFEDVEKLAKAKSLFDEMLGIK